MDIYEVVQLLEGLAKKDIESSGNFKAMSRLLELLSQKLDKDAALFIVSHTTFNVSDNVPINNPAEFERCVAAFAELSVNSKTAIEELLGEYWKAGITANPLTFSLQL